VSGGKEGAGKYGRDLRELHVDLISSIGAV
jgi:hypothetical protein